MMDASDPTEFRTWTVERSLIQLLNWIRIDLSCHNTFHHILDTEVRRSNNCKKYLFFTKTEYLQIGPITLKLIGACHVSTTFSILIFRSK